MHPSIQKRGYHADAARDCLRRRPHSRVVPASQIVGEVDSGLAVVHDRFVSGCPEHGARQLDLDGDAAAAVVCHDAVELGRDWGKGQETPKL